MPDNPLLTFALLAFVSMFTMVNPLGVVPVYVSMTAGLTTQQSRRVARSAVLTAWLTLVAFALTGQFIFDFFGISVNSLRVVGGVLFFLMGYEMLNARLKRERQSDESLKEFMDDIAITPLGIPIITGPGAITNAILLMNDHADLSYKAVVLGVLALVMLLTYGILRGGQRITVLLGPSGSTLMLRIMGLIVMVIAVEFFFRGATPLVRAMLKIE